MLRLRRRWRRKQEVSQRGWPAGERLTTEATPFLALDDPSPRGDDLRPTGNFDDVIQRPAPLTVEERTTVHSQLASRYLCAVPQAGALLALSDALTSLKPYPTSKSTIRHPSVPQILGDG